MIVMLYFQLTNYARRERYQGAFVEQFKCNWGCHNLEDYLQKSGQIDCNCWSKGPVGDLGQEEVIQELPKKVIHRRYHLR